MIHFSEFPFDFEKVMALWENVDFSNDNREKNLKHILVYQFKKIDENFYRNCKHPQEVSHLLLSIKKFLMKRVYN